MALLPNRPVPISAGSGHLLERYVARALLWPTVQLAGVLVGVMLLERGLRLLQEISALGIPARYMGPLLIRLVPYYAQQALPFGFVVAVALVLARMGRNREWEAMAGAGVSPARIARIMTLTAAAVAAATLLISGFLEPLGRHSYRRLHASAVNEARIGAIQPGAIYDQIPGVMLTATGKRNGRLEGVFLRIADGPKGEILATAQSARIAVTDQPGALHFVLEGGEMLIAGVRSVRFGQVVLHQPLELEQTSWQRGRDARELTLIELVTRPAANAEARRRQAAELYGKIARAIGLLALPWLALPLLAGSRGERRWLAIGTILFLVVAYYHAVNLSRNLAASSGISLGEAAWLTSLLPVIAGAAMWRLGSGVRQHAPVTLPFRLPRLRLPKPGLGRLGRAVAPSATTHLLTFYLTRRLGTMTLAVLAGLVLLLQVVDLLERGEALVSAGQGLSGFLRYAWLRLPATILQAAPLAMLGGGVLAFALLRSGNELVAIHAQGVSAGEVLLRSLAVPLCFGLALVGVSEAWSPRAQVAFSAWWNQVSPAAAAPATDGPRWFRIGADLVQAEPVDAGATHLRDVRIYRFGGQAKGISEWIHAGEAAWDGGKWTLRRVERWLGADGLRPVQADAAVWETILRPGPLARFMAAPIPLTGRDAWLARRDSTPIDRAETLYDVRVYMTASLAIAPLLMLMLAAALVVVPRQEVVLSVCLFEAATAGLAYLVLDGWLQVLGQWGGVPPELAVAGAPMLFGTLALEIILRSEARV
ncbi:MAG: LptF/LptG family permease [Novosphingobium sp.]|nr:LptF/LptG family permease [Novosphingobium sp.]